LIKVDKTILLTTNNLTVGYLERRKQIPILENINITLRRGELICLMGQNGVGKSTLLRALSAVQKPLKGLIEIDGSDVFKLSRTERAKKISLVLTERLNAGNLTVEEVVVMGRYPFLGLDLRLSSTDQKVVDQAIDQVGVRDLLSKPIHKLSDGQLQKVMIARALTQDGDIIILDEPTAHLDLNNRVSIIRLLKSLARNTNKVILMATHELDLALQTADRLLLAQQDGRIAEGLPEDLVLDGTLDRVFDLKGYDLKSGKYQHDQGVMGEINLIGEGYVFLWTKNALERVGFNIIGDAQTKVRIKSEKDKVSWIVYSSQNSRIELTSIKELISVLQ
jgi:iron complex transport system ATP-binding protein